MPSGSLQWVHLYDETDKDTRVTGYSEQIQLTNSSRQPLNGIVKTLLVFDSGFVAHTRGSRYKVICLQKMDWSSPRRTWFQLESLL
jgi:hypothetical protein